MAIEDDIRAGLVSVFALIEEACGKHRQFCLCMTCQTRWKVRDAVTFMTVRTAALRGEDDGEDTEKANGVTAPVGEKGDVPIDQSA